MSAKLTSLVCALLLSLPLLAQQQNVSGQVVGPDGGIAKVSVREVDATHRVYNHTQTDENGYFSFKVRDARHSLQFVVDGYHTLTHKILGARSIKATLEPLRDIPGLKNARIIFKSKKMLCGRTQGKDVKQTVWVEQLSDTLFALIVPIAVSKPTLEYPAGRNLMVLADNDKLLMQCENAVAVYPVVEAPDDIKNIVFLQSQNDNDYTPGALEDNESYYFYPHFLFSRKQLEELSNNPTALQRIVVDTYLANNYWNYYPTPDTQEELKKLHAAIQGK